MVLHLDCSDFSKVTGTVTNRPHTVVAVLWIFQVSYSLFHLCCIAIWLVIKHNLCCDLRLSCNHNFDHSGARRLMPVVFTSHIEKVFYVKIYVSSWNVFCVAVIICYCSSQILATWENYDPLLIALVEILFFIVLNFPSICRGLKI